MTATDISGVKAGTALPSLQLPKVTRTTLALFAGASGDHNPIHIDSDFARASGMDDVFAHGLLSVGYLSRVLVGFVPQRCLRSFEVRFEAITPLGAVPTCSGVVAEISEDAAGHRIAVLDLAVHLADGTRTISGKAVVELPGGDASRAA